MGEWLPGGGVSVAEASGTQPIGNLQVGDNVVDNSWEWEHRTGPDDWRGVTTADGRLIREYIVD